MGKARIEVDRARLISACGVLAGIGHADIAAALLEGTDVGADLQARVRHLADAQAARRRAVMALYSSELPRLRKDDGGP